MSDNIAPGEQLLIAAFNPQPDLETLPKTLVKVGIFISSSAFSAMLRPLPRAVLMLHIQYAFGLALAMIFLFGVGMIGIGWLVAENLTRYTTLGRTVMRASHVMLVFAVALHIHNHNPR